MNNEKKILPELRFPEFVNDGEWQYLNGDELFEPVSNRDHNSDLPILAISQEYGAIPREMIDYTVIASKESIKSYKVVEKGDFIISLRSFQGGIEFSNYKGICSPAYIILRKKKKLEDIFFKYYFKTDLYIRLLNKNLEGIRDGKMVSYSQFSEILLPYPSINEQKKIASFISSLDKLIEVHNKKLEAINEHKKGLMQNLFPQEGEKVPKFRFPEFLSNGEWNEKLLNEICEINPKSPSLPNEFVYIDLESVENGVLVQEKIIKKDGAPSRAQRLLEEKDVIFQLVRPYQGNNYHFTKNDKHDYVASTGYAQLRAYESSKFLFQTIHTDRFLSQVLKKCTGSNYPAINSTDLAQIIIQVPRPNEQQKIASCLSALDNLIKGQSDEIEQLKELKKGLLQSLFPNNIF